MAPFPGLPLIHDHDADSAEDDMSTEHKPFKTPITPTNKSPQEKIPLTVDSDQHVNLIKNTDFCEGFRFEPSILPDIQAFPFVEPAIVADHSHDECIAVALEGDKQHMLLLTISTSLDTYESSLDHDSLTEYSTDSEPRLPDGTTSQHGGYLSMTHGTSNSGAGKVARATRLGPACPEIMLSEVTKRPCPWQVTYPSALPWQQLKRPWRLQEAREGSRIASHPMYWNAELARVVNAWLSYGCAQLTYLELDTLVLGGQASSKGVAATCISLTAFVDSTAESIKLISLTIPEHAISCFDRNCEREWLIFRISWRLTSPSDDNEPRAHTVIAVPANLITQVAKHATLPGQPPKISYRMLLSSTGAMPMACGEGVDAWALEDFMTACWRGDGQITLNVRQGGSVRTAKIATP